MIPKEPNPMSPHSARNHVVYVYKKTKHVPYQEIILSIINGLDVSLVDPSLYTELYYNIQNEIPRIKQYNPAGANSMEKALRYIEADFAKNDAEAKLRLEKLREEERRITAKEVDEAFESVMNGGNPENVEPRLIPPLFKMLMDKRRKYITDREYAKAEIANSLVTSLVHVQETGEKVSDQQKCIKELEDHRERLWYEKHMIEERLNTDLNDYKSKMQQEIKSLIINNERELRSKKTELTSKVPLKYTKHSSRVLEMKTRFNSMNDTLTGDCAALKKEIEATMEKEDKENIQAYNEHVRETLHRIEEQGARKIATKKMIFQKVVQRKEANKVSELETVQKAIDHLNKEIEKQKRKLEETTNKRLQLQKSSLPLLKNKALTSRPRRRTNFAY